MARTNRKPATAEFGWRDRDVENFARNGRTPSSVADAARSLERLNCLVSRDCPLDYTLDPGMQVGSFACKLCDEGPEKAAAQFFATCTRAAQSS